MAKARQIVKRRKAVRNIRKITQTMQLIATTRFQRCLKRAVATKPYTTKITEMIETLSGAGTVDHPLLRENAAARASVLLTITSNRGLCGAYNASILRHAVEQRKALAARGIDAKMDVVGKKGIAFLKFVRVPVADTITDVEDKIAFARVAALAERYMKLYESGQIARVDVAYTRYVSAGVQRATVAQLLPIVAEPSEAASPPAASGLAGAGPIAVPLPAWRAQFEFSPAPEILLARLIPETVKVRLFQFFNDAIVSEQIARMVAMKSATEASTDMIKSLTRLYNRARQSQITLELADIVGGAEAVN
ncbi:MAG: ATP synthase F1 subunit gamma [Phycisphaerae bacterium]